MQCGFACLEAGAVRSKNTTNIIMKNIMDICIIYPPISHWVWSEIGWLNQLGYIDFSGCGPVHLLGGVCSFFGAVFLGPRLGRFRSKYDSEKEEIVGHSIPLVGIGGMILITGFLAFNGGSLGTMTNPGDGEIIARVISNTVLGGTGGGITILLATKIGLFGPATWNFSMTLNCALIGMVSVCAGVNNMAMWASFLCGVTAGPVYMLIHYAMLWCKVDDPLDAVAVHFGGGLWGLIAASLFANNGFVFGVTHESAMVHLSSQNDRRRCYHSVGVSRVLHHVRDTESLGKLRVSEEDERRGLDIAMHNEPGYHPMGWKTYPALGSRKSSVNISVLPTLDSSLTTKKHRSEYETKL
ncbi:hypothetical protein ANN_12180 [Periplaneta americana]|uniref:Ammonium transporter AmtB-like domain-containing protein n=1 Tax=Periplaneta americana TaxID=6978 RepID=A0ABQ8TIJ1_PERAM|nr:hypothetical protein ANN_12180 [Periplaneta americana]